MQVATIEFARNVCGTRLTPTAPSSIKAASDAGDLVCSRNSWQCRNKGASMRLGTGRRKFDPARLAEKIYGKDEVLERHRHRYEFNMKYRDQMRAKGFEISGHLTRWLARRTSRAARSSYFVSANITPSFKANRIQPHLFFKGVHSSRFGAPGLGSRRTGVICELGADNTAGSSSSDGAPVFLVSCHPVA